MGAFESNQAGVPTVQLVVVRPEGERAEAPAMALQSLGISGSSALSSF